MRESSPRTESEGSAARKGDHPLAIVLAADDAAVRPKLRRLLESAPGLEVVAEAGDVQSAVEAAVRHNAAALVLDLDRPGDISSLDTIRAVEQASPGTRVIVLMTSDDARFVRHALRAGAAACILDDLPGEDLIDAVRRAATQGIAPAQPWPGPRPDDLTERQFDVLRLLALGHTNIEIAAHLHLSVRTIEAHRAHLQQKLGRPSRAELVRYALDRGLLQATEDRTRG
jgi:two-component system, NarL family, response regulator NreC